MPFWATYEEQVSLFVNPGGGCGIVLGAGVKDAQAQGADVEYATTHEGYSKWMIAGFIPMQAKERGNLEKVYKALNWFLGGGLRSGDRGTERIRYRSTRPGSPVRGGKNWTDEQTQVIHENIHKIKVKFAHSRVVGFRRPEHLGAFEREMDRFRNA